MSSKLIILPVEKMQDEINKQAKKYCKTCGVYVSLNKTHEGLEKIFVENKIDTANIFFIDCVASEPKKEDVLIIHPTDIKKLSSAINAFIKEIPGEKFLLLDALSTLLIYNDENKVAQFVKEITEYGSGKGVEVVAFSPETKGEELLTKIFNFFDEVEKKPSEGNA